MGRQLLEDQTNELFRRQHALDGLHGFEIELAERFGSYPGRHVAGRRESVAQQYTLSWCLQVDRRIAVEPHAGRAAGGVDFGIQRRVFLGGVFAGGQHALHLERHGRLGIHERDFG